MSTMGILFLDFPNIRLNLPIWVCSVNCAWYECVLHADGERVA